jgi:hypothetical protein
MTLLRIRRPYGRAAAVNGFTLTEAMVGVSVFAMVLCGMISTNIFGMRLMNQANGNVKQNAEWRGAITDLLRDIRTGKNVKIGSGSAVTFSPVANNVPQKGGAVQIYPTTNTNTFIRYFWDGNARAIKRVTSGTATPETVAALVGNSQGFSAEDYAGNTLTNRQSNYVIGILFQIYDSMNSLTQGNTNKMYPIRLKVSRRPID